MTIRRIAVIQAGLSQPSSTRLLAERLATATQDALLELGDESAVTFVDLREHAHDLANTLLTGFATGTLRDALDQIAGADALLAVTPVFQASYSGLFKTFMDVLPDGALRGTPVLMAATAGTAFFRVARRFSTGGWRSLFLSAASAIESTNFFSPSEK